MEAVFLITTYMTEHNESRYLADSRFVPSQWETSLQNNAVSHWLGSNLESALRCSRYARILNNIHLLSFLYARLKNGRIMPWQCPSVRPSVHPSVCPSVRPSVRAGFPDFSSTCFEISIWNLVYTFSRWHNMSSLSCITIGSLWPSLQPKVGQTHFLQSWPHKSR